MIPMPMRDDDTFDLVYGDFHSQHITDEALVIWAGIKESVVGLAMDDRFLEAVLRRRRTYLSG